MMSEDEIIRRLKVAGCPEADISAVMNEVGIVICANAYAQYLSGLPEDTRETLLKLSPEEQAAYLEQNHVQLPAFSQEQFDTIHDATWNEYFATSGKSL
jgi:hypothetical protein